MFIIKKKREMPFLQISANAKKKNIYACWADLTRLNRRLSLKSGTSRQATSVDKLRYIAGLSHESISHIRMRLYLFTSLLLCSWLLNFYYYFFFNFLYLFMFYIFSLCSLADFKIKITARSNGRETRNESSWVMVQTNGWRL